ncbi:ribosomal protein S7 domain-containing protein [Myxozyma melibiosi]|uniref:Ribosomal protein S7 domain-containing protein n=1 Tax=Myxozyma melibiosi TaxID=54550 RepID=A0ABR1F8A4_9ASCO
MSLPVARRAAITGARRIAATSSVSLPTTVATVQVRCRVLRPTLTSPAHRLFSSSRYSRNEEKKSLEEEVGSPVGDVLARDAEGAEAAPEVLKEENDAVRDTLGDAAPEKPESESVVEEEILEEKEAAETIEDIGEDEGLKQGTPVEELLSSKTSENIAAAEASERLIEEEKKRKHLAEVSSHLINLRTSGLRIDDYIAKTGTTVLNEVRESMLAASANDRARIEELLAKRKEDKARPFEYRTQLVDARKSQQFVHQPLQDDEILSHLINMVMRDGKKTIAQRVVNEALIIVRMRLGQDPIEVLHYLVEKTQPLVQIIRKREGGKTKIIPRALRPRQRVCKALTWLLADAAKRPSPSYGVRLGDAIVSVRRGCDTGASLEKKDAIHKIAVENRSSIKATRR